MTAILDNRPSPTPACATTPPNGEPIVSLAVCLPRAGGCPMTGGDCPSSQAEIDKCPEC